MKASLDLRAHLYANRYFYLLAATIIQVFISSFFPDRETYMMNGITFTIFMLAIFNFIGHSRKTLLLFLFFAIVSILLAWVPTESETGQRIFVAERIIVIIFIMLIIYQIISQIVKSKEVSMNMILGVITIYVLFGLLAGECNQLIYYFDNEAFKGNVDFGDNADIRYYSYVTITTLGYGDIAPISQIARASAVFFSLTAQIYLAVVIALIVGKYVSYSDKKEL
jgi:hypothetical protein